MNARTNCRLGDPLPLNIGSDAAAPLREDIQWMPPGRHEVWPESADKPFEIEVTPDVAEAANAELQGLRSKAADGRGNWPYGDFNHEDREQSFEPLEFYWGGGDPKAGGVRLRLKWSASGEQAVKGKTFRSFSPSFWRHKETNAFLGIGLNVGGLVNRSAFTSIQSVARGAASTETKTKDKPMTEAEKQEITNLITGAVKPLTEQVNALAKLPERFEAMEKKVNAKAKTEEEEEHEEEDEGNKIVQLVEAALKPVAERLARIEEGGKTAVMTNAKKTVEEIGIKAGRIGAQDKDTIEFWEGAIATNAKAADALSKMPVNPALVQIVQQGSKGGTRTGTAGDNSPEGFAQLVEAKAKDGKLSKSKALDSAIAENVEGYQAWRNANGKPGLFTAAK